MEKISFLQVLWNDLYGLLYNHHSIKVRKIKIGNINFNPLILRKHLLLRNHLLLYLPWPTSLFHKLWNSKLLPPSSHTILKEWRVRKKNQQLFGCPKAKLGPLTRRLPYSPHVNHCEIPFLTCSSPVQKQYWTQYSTDWTGNFLVLRTTSYSTVLLSPTIFHQFRFDVLDMNTLLSLTESILGHNSHRITFPVIKQNSPHI